MPTNILLNNLKALRAAHSLTQEELAKKVGVSRKTINVIERGDYAPSVLLALKISRVFRVPVEHIFSYQDKEKAAYPTAQDADL